MVRLISREPRPRGLGAPGYQIRLGRFLRQWEAAAKSQKRPTFLPPRVISTESTLLALRKSPLAVLTTHSLHAFYGFPAVLALPEASVRTVITVIRTKTLDLMLRFLAGQGRPEFLSSEQLRDVKQENSGTAIMAAAQDMALCLVARVPNYRPGLSFTT